jgi:hypothetical protein
MSFFSLPSASMASDEPVRVRFPLTTRPTVEVVAMRPLMAGALGFLISLPSRRPRELVKEESLLPVVPLALGGRDVFNNLLLLLVPSAALMCALDELATWPDIVLLEGAAIGAGSGNIGASSEGPLALALDLVVLFFKRDPISEPASTTLRGFRDGGGGGS